MRGSKILLILLAGNVEREIFCPVSEFSYLSVPFIINDNILNTDSRTSISGSRDISVSVVTRLRTERPGFDFR